MPRSLALVLALYGVAVLAAQGGGPTRREIDALGPQARARFKQMQTLTVSGKVTYQACDDKICYVPTSVPVSWTFTLRTLDRERTKK